MEAFQDFQDEKLIPNYLYALFWRLQYNPQEVALAVNKAKESTGSRVLSRPAPESSSGSTIAVQPEAKDSSANLVNTVE